MTKQTNQRRDGWLSNSPAPGYATLFIKGKAVFQKEIIEGRVQVQEIPKRRKMTEQEIKRYGRSVKRIIEQ